MVVKLPLVLNKGKSKSLLFLHVYKVMRLNIFVIMVLLTFLSTFKILDFSVMIAIFDTFFFCIDVLILY